MDSHESNPRNTLPIMEPLLPYFYSVNFFYVILMQGFLRPDFTKKRQKKIQKKENEKEKKNHLEV